MELDKSKEASEPAMRGVIEMREAGRGQIRKASLALISALDFFFLFTEKA